MKYLEEAKYIWKNFIPKSGQVNNLQGELLRQLEKLRYEAQNNGNINWDSNFEYFCNFLNITLCNCGALSDEEKLYVSNALSKIKAVGQVAFYYNNGEISDEEMEEKYNFELAYVDDDLYDVVADAIAALYISHKQPIPYEVNPDIHR